MKVDSLFAARVAELAAEIVCDGRFIGTWEDPDARLEPGTSLGTALTYAGNAIWGGADWWRMNVDRASLCLQSIRWLICDNTDFRAYPEAEARRRWAELTTDETALMLLFAAQAIRAKRARIAAKKRAEKAAA